MQAHEQGAGLDIGDLIGEEVGDGLGDLIGRHGVGLFEGPETGE